MKLRRVPRDLNLADHLTKCKTWREMEELVRGVGGRMKVIKSGKDVGSKGAGRKVKSQFSGDSGIRAA